MEGLKLDRHDKMEGAITAAVLQHRDEMNTLRLAVAVLTWIPVYQASMENADLTQVDPGFKDKQDELMRLAKEYADETLLSGLGIDDLIALLKADIGGEVRV